MVMALPPGGKGPRTLRCVECDPSSDDNADAGALIRAPQPLHRELDLAVRQLSQCFHFGHVGGFGELGE
jgi:hypothetical protein